MDPKTRGGQNLSGKTTLKSLTPDEPFVLDLPFVPSLATLLRGFFAFDLILCSDFLVVFIPFLAIFWAQILLLFVFDFSPLLWPTTRPFSHDLIKKWRNHWGHTM